MNDTTGVFNVGIYGSNDTLDATNQSNAWLNSGTNGAVDDMAGHINVAAGVGANLVGQSNAMNGEGTGMRLNVFSNAALAAVNPSGPSPVVDLFDGVGGYKTAAAALTGDGNGGKKLLPGGANFIGFAKATSLTAYSFKIG